MPLEGYTHGSRNEDDSWDDDDDLTSDDGRRLDRRR